MRSFEHEVVASARSRIGLPSWNHYLPTDRCQRGQISVDSCMNAGLDERGFDCAGLAIVALSEAMGVEISEWPRGLRHVAQMHRLVEPKQPEPGDIIITHMLPGVDADKVFHAGIFSRVGGAAIHANGKTGLVNETYFDLSALTFRVITARQLAELASR